MAGRRIRRTRPFLVILVLVAGVSCERAEPPVAAGEGSPLGDWKLASGRGPEGNIPIVAGSEIRRW